MHQLMKKAGAITGKRFGLIATTLVSSFSLSYFAADPYLAMLLPANALGEKYDEMGIDRRVLSRTLEDGGTVVCPMVPWGTSGIYCAATLGIPVLEYPPYYIMGFATPVFSLKVALRLGSPASAPAAVRTTPFCARPFRPVTVSPAESTTHCALAVSS